MRRSTLLAAVLAAGGKKAAPDPLLTDIVAYWKLDEVSGGTGAVTRQDSVGSSHLTDRNTTPSATGLLANGADCELDNSEFMDVADNEALSMGDIDFTFALWIKPESVGATRYLLSKGANTVSAAGFEYRVYINAVSQIVLNVSNGTTDSTLTSTTTVDAGSWYFLVLYHDAANNKLGVSINNGAFKTSDYSGGVQDSSGRFALGSGPGSLGSITAGYDGIMDEVGIWKRMLTAGEITRLYNGGSGYNSFLAG